MTYSLELCCLTSSGEKTINKIWKKYKKEELDKVIPLLIELAQFVEKNNEVDYFDTNFDKNKKLLLNNFLLTEEHDEATLIMPVYLNILDKTNHLKRIILMSDYE